MKFLADECVDRQIVDRLRQESYEVLYVVEMEPGISDDEVLNLANLEKSILLTADKDFGDLIFRQNKITTGVILIQRAGLLPWSKSRSRCRCYQRPCRRTPTSIFGNHTSNR